jgi:hypothetical protein
VKHYSDEAWSDFARKIVPEATRVKMQQHIDSGCEKCASTVRVWQNLFAVTQAEAGFVPPPDTVRIVKSQFVPPLPPSPGFHLTFDSSLQPVTAGIRGSMAATQFLYESDDYFIDLRVEPRRAEDQDCLIGQVLRRTGREPKISGLRVWLKEADAILASTTTNDLGEFQLEFSGAGRPYLVINQDLAGDITLPLYGVGRKSFNEKDLDRWV